MQIILKKEIKKLGRAGEVVSVRDGYARNFLLPQGLALPATPANLKVVERERKRALLREEKERQKARELADRINSTSCTITVQTGQDGRLFGSVTAQDISEAYKLEGIEVDRKKIELSQPIKEIGVFKVNIKLHPEVTAQAKVWVVKE